MAAQIIDGKAFAKKMRSRILKSVNDLKQNHNFTPTLAVVLVGDDPASQVYVRNKIKFTLETNMQSIERKVSKDINQFKLGNIIKTLNQDESIDGILLQLPLPSHLNASEILDFISPEKDVDGLTTASAGRLSLGKSGLRPCTPTGCVMLAKDMLGDLTGKHCVVLGRSILVGQPAALLFLEQNCTVTIAHSKTQNIEALCRTADILITAAGRPLMVKQDWIKPDACVIDVGINRITHPTKTRLVGDVDFENVSKTAGSITPVPGGVGPMTISCLLRNTVVAACLRRHVNVPLALEI